MQGLDRRRWVAGRPGRGQITTRADPRGRQSNSGSHAPAGQALTFSTSKSVAKALRGAIGREKKRGIPTILLARSGSIRAFATDLDNLAAADPPGRAAAGPIATMTGTPTTGRARGKVTRPARARHLTREHVPLADVLAG